MKQQTQLLLENEKSAFGNESPVESIPVYADEKLSTVAELVGEIPVQEGKTLPNSVTEDIGGFSLTPAYSVKQLRCIGKKHGKKGITRKARNQWRMVATW